MFLSAAIAALDEDCPDDRGDSDPPVVQPEVPKVGIPRNGTGKATVLEHSRLIGNDRHSASA